MAKVAIIGASMGGLSAAISAASNGANVTVYDRKSNIRDFYGGEIWPALYDHHIPAGAQYAADNFVFYVNKTHYVKLPPETIYMLDRDIYQEALAKKASSLGCKILLSTPAMVSKLRHQYDVIIDASGYPSCSLGEYGIGRVKEIATALYYISSGDFSWCHKDLHMWWLPKKTLGYFWIFPKNNGTKANIGIGWVHDHINQSWKPPTFKDIDDFLHKLNIKQTVSDKGGHVVPLVPLKQLRYENVLLVGDAAGLMNSTLAAGNHLAAESGRIAGLCAAINKLDSYEHRIKDSIGPELRNSQILYNLQKRLSFNDFDEYFPILNKVGPDIFFTRQKLIEAGIRFLGAKLGLWS